MKINNFMNRKVIKCCLEALKYIIGMIIGLLA